MAIIVSLNIYGKATDILLSSSLLEIFFLPASKLLDSIRLINRTADPLNVLDIELIEMTYQAEDLLSFK